MSLVKYSFRFKIIKFDALCLFCELPRYYQADDFHEREKSAGAIFRSLMRIKGDGIREGEKWRSKLHEVYLLLARYKGPWSPPFFI